MSKNPRSSGLGTRWAAVFAVCIVAMARSGASAPIKTIEPGTLQVCLYPGFEPFAWRDDGVWKGWDVDYLEEFANENGLKFRAIEVKEFKGIWRLPGEDKCDIAATGISDTQSRRDDSPGGAWSKTYYTVVRAFLIRSGDRLEDIHDLRSKTVIVTEGSTADTDLQNRARQAGISGEVTIHYTENETAAAGQVKDSGAFAYAGGYGSVKTLASKIPGLKVTWAHCNMVRAGGAFKEYSEPFSFVVRSASTALPSALDGYIVRHTYKGTANPPSVKCQPRPEVTR